MRGRMDLETWRAGFQDLPKVGIIDSNEVEGLCKKVAGGRALFARIRLAFRPADRLLFEVEAPQTTEAIVTCRQNGWLDAIWLGVLDSMLVYPLNPITAFECVLTHAEVHPIDSSGSAFRLAGRYAARSFLERAQFVIT